MAFYSWAGGALTIVALISSTNREEPADASGRSTAANEKTMVFVFAGKSILKLPACQSVDPAGMITRL